MFRTNRILLVCLALFGLTSAGCAADASKDGMPSMTDTSMGSAANTAGQQPGASSAGSTNASGETPAQQQPAATEPAKAQPANIVETAIAAGSFTKLAAALQSADLVGALQGEGPFTVFAPTDAAFEAFEAKNPGVLASLSKEQLTSILEYHVIAGATVRSTNLVDGSVATMLSGSPALISLSAGAQIDDAKVTKADVEASNGVIHVIDSIMLPPEKDIVETAVAAGMFTNLASALTSAGLVDALKGEGPFTVFAPTDTAFAALPAVPTGDALKQVLLYHVVKGAIGSGDLSAGSVEMLSGNDLTVSLTGGVKVDGANVVKANILAKNGVIHVIDGVLVPR